MSHAFLYGGGIKNSNGSPAFGIGSVDYETSILKDIVNYTGVTISVATISAILAKVTIVQPQITYVILKIIIIAIISKTDPTKALTEAGFDLIMSEKVIEIIQENLPV